MVGRGFYHEELMEHYRYSPYRGTLDDASIVADELNPSCGDHIAITAKVIDEKIKQIRFSGSGCVLSQAAASLLAEQVTGARLEVVLALSRDDILQLIGLQVGPTRLKCAMLSLQVLQEGIRRYLSTIEKGMNHD